MYHHSCVYINVYLIFNFKYKYYFEQKLMHETLHTYEPNKFKVMSYLIV